MANPVPRRSGPACNASTRSPPCGKSSLILLTHPRCPAEDMGKDQLPAGEGKTSKGFGSPLPVGEGKTSKDFDSPLPVGEGKTSKDFDSPLPVGEGKTSEDFDSPLPVG